MDAWIFWVVFFHAGGVVAPQLGKLHRPVRSALTLDIIALRIQLRCRLLKKTVIFAAKQDNIQIVVPRDKALVPHRAKRRARKKLIADRMLSASRVKILQHLQKEGLMGR